MSINEVTTLDRDGDVAVVTIDYPPVNALSAAVRKGVAAAMEQAFADDAVKAIVLICAGKTFFAGADITEFGKPLAEPTIRQVQEVIEAGSKPVIAAMHGTALGGGFELALAAHYRVALATAKMGLPEVKLGLLPGAGGTQRLPRVVGVERALDMMTAGDPVSAHEAAEIGLVDEVIVGDLRAAAVVFAQSKIGAPLDRIRDRPVAVDPAKIAAFRETNVARFRNLDAPEAIIRTVEATALPFDEGLDRERDLFRELMAGPQSAALRYVFFAERQAAKADPLPASVGERLMVAARMKERDSDPKCDKFPMGNLSHFDDTPAILSIVNEGARLLDEGLAPRALEIDALSIRELGWPAYRGGPMFWADQQGLPVILEKLHAAGIEPSSLIERLAAENKGFAQA
jgi:3-hydroxyacyl-CoA dehydrogenase